MTLVFHHGALGDSLLLHPLLASLTGPVTLVTRGSLARLAARLLPGVCPADLDAPPWSALFAPGGGDPGPLQQAGAILSFISDGRDAWADNVRRLAPRARILFVDPRPPADWTGHVTQWHRGQLQRQGLSLPPAPPGLARGPAAGPVVIHPGSGGLAKCWPAERFRELARRLGDQTEVRLIRGEAECDRDLFPEADSLMSLEALEQALRGASLYVGNDSGPTHLAARLGVPTVALFGPTDPRVWRPVGPRVIVLAPPTPRPMTWLEVSAVLAAVKAIGHTGTQQEGCGEGQGRPGEEGWRRSQPHP